MGIWEVTKYFKTEAGAREFASRIQGEWCIRNSDTDVIVDNSLNYVV